MTTIKQLFSYNDRIVKYFLYATLFWGSVALLAGLLIASQLSFWQLNFDTSWLTFGRLRPLHTNAAIFAFIGNAVFAGIYHSTQRLCKARIFSDALSKLHFWGWQLVIVFAAISLPLGITTGKEYAELEWPIDILITVVWVIFAINFFGTLYRRRERHMYVALWFYIATIVTIALLHIVNSLAFPVSLVKSYPIFAGVQDALVQWWYGHNAVAFFLTTPFLGLMYYYIPKAVNKPIYSYRLSIIHFWSLVFIYIWAGPHHLLNTALPDWAQTLGMVFSVMLLAPSWGGMINGLLTLRMAWDRVRREPLLKFFVLALTFYGMSTFEGPLLSIKSVNSLAHYTDWIIGHVHGGALGWNGFMVFAILYYLVPKLWKTDLHSQRLANVHFWTATIGIMLYMLSMWAAGITQGLMWRGIEEGSRLMYPDFVETVTKILPLYYVRLVGGLMYFTGYILLLFNIIKTIRNAPKSTEEDVYEAPAIESNNTTGHRYLEGVADVFIVLTFVAVLIGSVIEILPSLIAHKYMTEDPIQTPYTPLQLAGRDIYIREGCYTCHSQMVRTMPSDVIRYGEYSKPEEFIYDRPFQWGSRRIGPDLARVGGKYPDLWHYRHMLDTREVTPQSIMPNYPWLFESDINFSILKRKLSILQAMGTPYTPEEVEAAIEDAKAEAKAIAEKLEAQGIPKGQEMKEIMALIAYLQRLKPLPTEADH